MQHKFVWIVSHLLSLLLLIGIVLAIQELNKGGFRMKYALKSQAQVEQVLEQYWKNKTVISGKHSTLIPTGVFIESLSFKSADKVNLSGYVWQHVSNQLDDSKVGVVFPEAINLTMKKAYTHRQGNTRVIGWYFEGDFIQKFDYSKYPFDYKTVWIKIWQKEFAKEAVLVPDFNSYTPFIHDEIIGIEDDIVLRNFYLIGSFFDYDLSNYDTNFGIRNFAGKFNFPELRFNVLLKRQTLNAVIINLAPLIIAILVAYFSILTESVGHANEPKRRADFLSVLRSGAFLLFIVVVAHIQLRSNLFGNQLVLLDNIYFITYVAILMTVLIAYIAFLRDSNNRCLKLLKKNGLLLPKLAFFPIVLSALLVVLLVY